MSRLVKRGQVYYYSIRIPSRLINVFDGRREILENLGARSEQPLWERTARQGMCGRKGLGALPLSAVKPYPHKAKACLAHKAYARLHVLLQEAWVYRLK